MTTQFAIQIRVLTFWNLHLAAMKSPSWNSIIEPQRADQFVHASENNKLLKNCSLLLEQPFIRFPHCEPTSGEICFAASREKLFLHTRAVILSSFEVERAQGS